MRKELEDAARDGGGSSGNNGGGGGGSGGGASPIPMIFDRGSLSEMTGAMSMGAAAYFNDSLPNSLLMQFVSERCRYVKC